MLPRFVSTSMGSVMCSCCPAHTKLLVRLLYCMLLSVQLTACGMANRTMAALTRFRVSRQCGWAQLCCDPHADSHEMEGSSCVLAPPIPDNHGARDALLCAA
jgi:hypothetical protein